MQDERNASQIIRKDARNCFVESLSDAFGNYYVKEGDCTPQYVYREKQIVSAIMSISGMSLFGNTVRYHIHQR